MFSWYITTSLKLQTLKDHAIKISVNYTSCKATFQKSLEKEIKNTHDHFMYSLLASCAYFRTQNHYQADFVTSFHFTL